MVQELSNPVRHQHYFHYGGDSATIAPVAVQKISAAWIDEEAVAEEVRCHPILYNDKSI